MRCRAESDGKTCDKTDYDERENEPEVCETEAAVVSGQVGDFGEEDLIMLKVVSFISVVSDIGDEA